ncbi:MAG: M1 family metallopeptidase [Roseivirga sp.]|nr:M1 family metallopeptidase [Roseivirga sp.]
MKLKLIFLTMIICSALQGQKHHDRFNTIDIRHYKFEIGLNDTNDKIEGMATVSVKFKKNATRFTLDLANETRGKGMTVTGLSEGGNKVPFEHNQGKLTLRTTAKAGDIKHYEISYQGVPATGLIISKNKYGDRTFFGDNWPDRGQNWLPTVDHPSDKATVEWIVTAPSHYQVVGNGYLVERTNLSDDLTLTHWKSKVQLPTKVMVFGAARFAIQKAGEVSGIPISSWVYPQDRENGFYDYALAVEITDWFINHVGPYPYAKLANVQSKTQFGGMENASNIFYTENSVNGNRTSEGLIAHEIAHQWFGNSASEANWHHIWLSEGFATYFTILYKEQKYGKAIAAEDRLTDKNQIIAFNNKQSVPVVNTAIDSYMKLLNANSYQKGGFVLHMLRQEVGDQVFWQAIKTYYDQYKLSNALTEDLKAVFEEASGKDLDGFFQQWIYQAGHPDLRLDWQFKGGLQILVDQRQQGNFDFPLEIEVVYKDGSTQREVLKVNQKKQAFTIKADKKPAKIVLDPDTNLLFEGKVTGR